MLDDTPVIYKARSLRWSLALLALFSAWTFLWPTAVNWRNTPSLVKAGSFLPLWVWGVLLVVYAGLLITDHGNLGRITAYAIGAGVSLVFATAYVVTIAAQPSGTPKNGFALMAMLALIVFHLASIKVTVARKTNEL